MSPCRARVEPAEAARIVAFVPRDGSWVPLASVARMAGVPVALAARALALHRGTFRTKAPACTLSQASAFDSRDDLQGRRMVSVRQPPCP